MTIFTPLCGCGSKRSSVPFSQLRFKVEADPPLHSMQASHTLDPLPSISCIPGGTLLVPLAYQEGGGREGGRGEGGGGSLECVAKCPKHVLYVCV